MNLLLMIQHEHSGAHRAQHDSGHHDSDHTATLDL